ncbi:putative glycosyltransferase [Candidatus Sulfopaludibacter sp. SbA6]|nr:putative glycosyltransferase [Candidatus Sulfopaludibacter sp. SbA6]
MNPVCVAMRAHNDMPLVAETLRSLATQRRPFTLVAFDNASTDGTLEEIRKHTGRIQHVPAGAYVPGRVLNQAMAATEGEVVVFLNSDCTPQNDSMLDALVAGFADDKVAAVFGRQMPRPDCRALMAKDTDDTYGDGARQRFWRHCFSMAVSGIRRTVWEKMPFQEDLQYSEDIDWTWRARQRGYEIRYVPDAIAMHSHNYTLRQYYKRHFGEGRAEAQIFAWTPWERSLVRYSLMPYVRQVASDWKYCAAKLRVDEALYSPLLRMAQLAGRRRGFSTGWRELNR